MNNQRLEPGERKVQYWVPGQLIMLAEHPSDDEQFSPQRLIERIKRATFIADRLGSAIARPERVLTFDHGVSKPGRPEIPRRKRERPYRVFLPHIGSGQAAEEPDLRRASQEQFSLVFFDLADNNDGPRLTALIDELNSAIRGELARLFKEHGGLERGQFLIRAAAPNWLSTPSGNWGSTSGPGARPKQAKEDDFEIELFDMPPIKSGQESVDVEVAILDTAPSKEQLHKAYDKWVANQVQPHGLLRRLLDNNGAFDVEPGSKLELITAADLGTDFSSLDELRVRDHDYPMSDHGLFAAGIINSIAPNARLRLLEVLNERGIGTLESVGRGLLKLVEERRFKTELKPLVVNMSLTLAIPLEGHPTPMFDWKTLKQDRPLVSLAPQWMCAALDFLNASLVASAGNDADEPDTPTTGGRPQARHPAAFETVLGVGALLEDSDEPTEYSNLSDSPESQGVWTFGGKALSDEVEAETGMLGVYIGGFPTVLDPDSEEGLEYKTEPSTTGWGWWAGTSFAAPIVSGTLAALAEQAGQLEAAETHFHTQVSASAGPIGRILRAKQGGT